MRLSTVALGGLLTSLLAGCQTLESGKEAALAMAPVQEVRHGISKPEALYAIGRYLQGQLRYDEAIATYRRLLDIHPQHTEARNALGLVLAAQGKYDQAIVEFETAAANAPNAVAVRNNLGYAYLLQGNAARAIAVLEATRTLAPTNRRVLDNLDMALARKETEAATAVPPHDAPVHTAVAPAAAAAIEPSVRLEISNANGVTRMARDTARELAAAGYVHPRLTNVPPYQLPTTEIQYRPGFEAQALRLRETLRNDIPISPSPLLRWDIQLRLALGKDVRSTRELMAPQTYAQQ